MKVYNIPKLWLDEKARAIFKKLIEEIKNASYIPVDKWYVILYHLYKRVTVVKLKPIFFFGSSLNTIRNLPDQVKRDIGWQLQLVQSGKMPVGWKMENAV